MLSTVVCIVAFVVFVALLAGLWMWSRRTESDMDFAQSEGVDTNSDATRLGIALSSNASVLGGH